MTVTVRAQSSAAAMQQGPSPIPIYSPAPAAPPSDRDLRDAYQGLEIGELRYMVERQAASISALQQAIESEELERKRLRADKRALEATIDQLHSGIGRANIQARNLYKGPEIAGESILGSFLRSAKHAVSTAMPRKHNVQVSSNVGDLRRTPQIGIKSSDASQAAPAQQDIASAWLGGLLDVVMPPPPPKETRLDRRRQRRKRRDLHSFDDAAAAAPHGSQQVTTNVDEETAEDEDNDQALLLLRAQLRLPDGGPVTTLEMYGAEQPSAVARRFLEIHRLDVPRYAPKLAAWIRHTEDMASAYPVIVAEEVALDDLHVPSTTDQS